MQSGGEQKQSQGAAAEENAIAGSSNYMYGFSPLFRTGWGLETRKGEVAELLVYLGTILLVQRQENAL